MSEVLEKAASSPSKSAKSLLEQGKSAENQSGEGCANTPSPWQNPDAEGLNMLAVKMPDETSPRKRGEWVNPRVTYTLDELEFIRVSAKTMTDRQIADAMGWNVVRVMGVRRTNKIPAAERRLFWTPEKLAQLHDLYIVQGKSSGEVSGILGCTPAALRMRSASKGWVHDPAHTYRNRSEAARASLAVRGRGVRKPIVVAPSAHQSNTPVLRPSGLHLAPIVFAAPPTETETLGDRILRELSAKPLSAASLATLLGEKELLVSFQLAAFAHEGRVEVGPVGDRGLRYKVWSVVDQYSSGANSAASLRCGPDSLVVAGEAA